MVKRFWQTISWLSIVCVVFTFVSWLYLDASRTVLNRPATAMQLFILPTDFPSIWSFVLPSTASVWVGPVVVLLLRVVFTGGFYGTLVRANTGQSTGISTFSADALRSFWRLLVWTVLWFVITIVALGLAKALQPLSTAISILLFVVRALFLFADIALVSEQHATILEALKRAVTTLMNAIVPMFPFIVIVTLLSGGALYLSGELTMIGTLGVAVLYSVIMTWISHLMVARYLYFSNWQSRSGAVNRNL